MHARVSHHRARAAMEAAETKMIEEPMNQKALDRFLEAQATYEAVGGLTQDRRVAQVRFELIGVSPWGSVCV